MVTFGRVLREAGLEVGPGRIADALSALDAVDIGRQDDVYWSLRTTLVTRFEEIEPFDRAFNAWFLRAPVMPPARVRSHRSCRGRRTGGRADPVRGAERDAPRRATGGRLERRRGAAPAATSRAMTPEEFAQARGC